MSTFQFFCAASFGWALHYCYAAMRRMVREIELDERERSRDRYSR